MENNLLSLEYSEINEEIRQRAINELNETEENKIKCLKELKEIIKCERNLNCNLENNFLLQFLRVKKFNADKAFCLIKKYYGLRKNYKSVYKNYVPTNILRVMETTMMNFLPWRSPDGSAVWIFRIGMWEPDKIPFEEALRSGLICNEKVLQNPVTQICGIISIVDCEKLSLTHLFHTPPAAIRCFVSAIQNCFPIRHVAIHIINNPGLFAILFAMVKPLLKEKIKDRIYFHGYDLRSLHQFVPPDVLPEEYGGTKGKFENPKFLESLMKSDDEFIYSNRFGYKD